MQMQANEAYPMKPNVGRADQIVRIVVGVGLFLLPTLLQFGPWGSWAVYLVGAILIATALFNFCPIYAALGLSTRRHLKS